MFATPAARLTSTMSLVVVLGLVMAACAGSPSKSAEASGGASGTPSTATGGTVHIGWGGAPDSLNPGNGLLEESYILYELVYDTPIGLNGDGKFVPELATDWSQSADGLTWTMHLVNNAKFHDGTPLTSALTRTGASHLQQIVRQDLADIGPGSDFAFNVALGLQLLEGNDHSGARKFVFPGQIASGRQPSAGQDSSFEDRRAQFVVEPAVERDSGERRGKTQGQRSGLFGQRRSSVVWPLVFGLWRYLMAFVLILANDQ